MITAWRALSNAVGADDWPEAERLANDLARQIDHELADRASRVDHDGLYSIGWQHYQGAPTTARRALDRFNAALRRVPISRRK